MAIGQEYSERKFGAGRSRNANEGEKRSDKFDIEKLYAYYDRSKKSVADWIWEYQSVSNYGYYKTTSNTLDYRYKLIDLYDHCMLDTHLTSIVDSLFHQIIGERYSIVDSEGETIEDATELIKRSWFVDYVKEVLYAKLYGYSMVELGDYNEETGTLDEIKSISRRNVAVRDRLVLEFPEDTAGWDIDSKQLKDDYVLIDGKEGYGWLLKAVPVVLSKRFALSSHTQYAETYGIPMIVGKTTDEDYVQKKELANEIAQARDSRVIVTGMEDEITFLNQISNDTNKIFTELVRLANDEMTMLILGQSATTESQAYVGSAEIQYRVMVDRVQAIREYVSNHINENLVWRLREKGLKIPETAKFGYSNILELSPDQVKDNLSFLTERYEVSPEQIYEQTGIKVGRQILEESNDQLLEYGEKTVKERGNPDNAKSKSAVTEQNIQRKENREEKLKEEFPDKVSPKNPVENKLNFFDSVAGCDFDKSITEIERCLKKLDSEALSSIDVVNTINKVYSSYHDHKNDIVAQLNEDVNKFMPILYELYTRIYNGDESAVEEAIQRLSKVQYNILSEIFSNEYGLNVTDVIQDEGEEGYLRAALLFFATFSASKQTKLMKIISGYAETYSEDYDKFVSESNKAVSLFNKTYHIVEGEVMESGYSFAKVWRSEPNDDMIFEYATQGDDRVRPNHMALSGIRMRKSEWANSSFLPPWAYGCRCYLFNTGTMDGRTLTNSRQFPDEDIVSPEFRTNVGESGAVFSRQHPYYEDLTQKDASIIRRIIENINEQ